MSAHRALPLDVVEAERQAARVAWADQQAAATLRERFPNCDGSCEAGRSVCGCQPIVPDRAAEEFDKEEELSRKEKVNFWAIASAPAISILGVAGFYIYARFGHVWL